MSSRGAALALALLLALLCAPSPAPAAERPLVVATTTVLGSIVKDLAGDAVDVDVIASPSVCPAHYDVRPSDVEAFRMADLVLSHGVEPWVGLLREASGSQAPVVTVRGAWNTPAGLRKLYESVAKALMDYLGVDVSTRLASSLRGINETESWLKSFASERGFVGTPVVAMKWQEPFVSFLGFKVVATYGPPEMVTPKEYKEVVANATKWGAVMVIDNLQSGVELGESVATEVGAAHVALTNFPDVRPGLSNVTEVMKCNAKALAAALAEARLMGELAKARGDVELWRALSVALGGLAAVFAAAAAVLAAKLRRRAPSG